MVLGEIPLAYKLQIFGAENVKKKLQEIDEQMERGTLSKEDAVKEYKQLGRQSRDVTNSWRVERNILLATHPALNKLTRGMSLVSSISRSALAIGNSLNLMWLRQGQGSSALAILNHELAEATRDFNRAVDEGDLEAQADAQERMAIAMAKIKEEASGDWGTILTDALTITSGIASAVSTSFLALTKNPKIISALFTAGSKLGVLFGGIFTGFASLITGVGTWLSTSLLAQSKSGAFYKSAVTAGGRWGTAFMGGALTALALAGWFAAEWLIPEIEKALSEMNKKRAKETGQEINAPGSPFVTKGKHAELEVEAIKNLWRPITDLFGITIPQSFKVTEDANAKMMNGIIGVDQQGATIIQTGFNTLNKGVNDSINQMISNYNRIAKKTKQPTLSLGTFSPAPAVTFPLIAAATGFSGIVKNPTVFLAGESGSEMVNITPSSGHGSGGGSIIINQYIYGSVIAEREVGKLANKSLKEGLKRRGVTGF